jgi:hypothetical protein
VRGAITNHPARKQYNKKNNGRLTARRGHHKKGPQEKEYRKGGVQCPAFSVFLKIIFDTVFPGTEET